MTADFKYELNDLVWAKMKGFPPWPGRVCEPVEGMRKVNKKNLRCIYFYGSDNHAWIEVGCLKPYFEFKDTLTYHHKKTHGFKEACQKIEKYIEDGHYVRNNGLPKTTAADSSSQSSVQNDRNSSFNAVQTTNVVKPPKKTARMSIGLSSALKRRNIHDLAGNKGRPKKVVRIASASSSTPNGNTDVLTNLGLTMNYSSPLRRNNSLLDRPQVTQLEITPLDVSTISSSLLNKNISPSKLSFGFIGLGNIGSGIVKNLLNSGHTVMVWNRTPTKMHQFEDAGATVGLTPSDVVLASDITFSCVSDPQVAKDMVFGNCGALSEIREGKAYVEMSGIDPESSQDIAEAITGKGGRYLETMIQGSKTEAEEGNLVCMSAGDKTLFDDCQSSFCAMAKNSFFLGEIGSASKMNLILHSIKAVSIAGLAEGMALAERANIQQKDMLEILGMTSLKCPMLLEKGKAMIDNNFNTKQALKHIQKDLNLSLNWADALEQPCPVIATVNELFKHAKRLGYSDHDTSAVYVRAKF